MIRKFSICICLLFAVFLTSCGGRTYQDPEVVISDVEAEKQAVVVFKVRGKRPLLAIGNGPKVSFDLAKIEPLTSEISISKVFYRVKPGFFNKLNPWSSQWNVLMIQPGFYVIDNISWESGNTTYYARKDPIPTSCPVKYGAFQVKPGTVNYLGDLEFGVGKGCRLAIAHTDQFPDAQEMLRKSHPEIADRLIRVEFLPGGYFYLQPHLPSEQGIKGDVPGSVSKVKN